MKRLLYILIMGMLFSCEKALFDEDPSADPRSNFESLWETVNDKYSFFELKKINWDSIYTYYSPQVTSATTDAELFSILDSMLFDLRDGHVNLVSPFNLSRNWQWFLDYPDNFDYEVLERNYLGNDYKIAGGMEYTILDNVGYIYYGSFSSSFTTENLNQVLSYMKNTSGIVFDVRSNGGGNLYNSFRLAERFVSSQKEILISVEKTGPAHNDFGNALTYTIEPSNEVNYPGPIVVLTNRRSYSATNTFAAIMKQLENVVVVGDQTGGGGGIPVDYELPNGWRYRFSATRSFIYLNNELYDIELGVPPDIPVASPDAQLAQGHDKILEFALDLLQ